MNPIDEDRLQFDAVNNIKKVVKNYYQKKTVQGNQLLSDLDKMNVERPTIINIKKYFTDNQQVIPELGPQTG